MANKDLDTSDEWVSQSEASRILNVSRGYVSQRIGQLSVVLGGVQVTRGKQTVWRFQRSRCEYFAAARAKYLVQRLNLRADYGVETAPTDSGKAPK